MPSRAASIGSFASLSTESIASRVAYQPRIDAVAQMIRIAAVATCNDR